jgi:hypothetical protein
MKKIFSKIKIKQIFNNCLCWLIVIVYFGFWVALVAGFISGDFYGLQLSFFSLAVLFIWNMKTTAEKEVVETIIKNTDFNLDNIENFLFASHETVIDNLNEIMRDPKNEFRKYRIQDLLERYIYSIPITYEVNLHIKPNYKNLFDTYHKLKSLNPNESYYHYPKIKNNDNFIYGESCDENYEQKPNPRITIIGNSINEFIQSFINGECSKSKDFYVNFKDDRCNSYTKEIFNRVGIDINENDISIRLFENFDGYGEYDDLQNKYDFPFRLIVREFETIFFRFNKAFGDDKGKWGSLFYQYNKNMIKKFSDRTQEKFSYSHLKYDIDKTLEWYNLDKWNGFEDEHETKLSDLKILDLQGTNEYTNIELFDITVKRHVFTHEFYTIYFGIDFYLNK